MWLKIADVIFIIVAIVACLNGAKYGLGSHVNPGPGAMPFLFGIALGAFSLFDLLSGFRKGKSNIKDSDVWGDTDWKKVGITTISLVMYAGLFNMLGFLLGTFSLCLVLYRVVEQSSFVKAVIPSILISVLSYIFFKIWFGLPLPSGMISIL